MASPRFSLAGQRGSWTDMRVQRQSDSLVTLALMMTLAVSRRLLSKYHVTESEGIMSATLWKATSLQGKYKHVKSEMVFTKYLLAVLNCLPVGVVPLHHHVLVAVLPSLTGLDLVLIDGRFVPRLVGGGDGWVGEC